MEQPNQAAVQDLVSFYYQSFNVLPPVYKEGEANLSGMVQQLVHMKVCDYEELDEFIQRLKESQDRPIHIKDFSNR